jgi:hypothetical protein
MDTQSESTKGRKAARHRLFVGFSDIAHHLQP